MKMENYNFCGVDLTKIYKFPARVNFYLILDIYLRLHSIINIQSLREQCTCLVVEWFAVLFVQWWLPF
jgi:hypothetical protein